MSGPAADARIGVVGKTSPVARRLFTVDEYYRMAEAGVLGPDDRVELLEGEIVTMSPIGNRHAGCVNALNQIFTSRLAGRAVVTVQNPVRLDTHSEPQPDVCLLRPRADSYRSAHPRPRDVLLLVEVSDTTQEYDRGEKLRAYAKAEIAEVWIVDLAGEAVESCREPRAEGYARIESFRRGQNLSPAAFADLRVGVDEILG